MRRPIKALFVLIPALTVGLLALPTVAGAASTPVAPASFSFSGAGWGHGVGLSQYGAKGQAVQGRTATQILQHYYSGTRVAAFRDDVDLRVNLAYLASTVRMRVEALSSSKAYVQVAIGGKVVKAGTGDLVDLSVKSDKIVLRVDGVVKATGGPAVIRWSGTRVPGSTGSAPAVLNVVSGGKSLDTSGHRYRYGHLEVRARESSVVNATVMSAVNIVRLHDEYVFGVGEMPSSWPAAALQAQAIASRGYALVKYRQGVRSGCWCHVFTDTSDQVFVGWSKQAGPSGERWTAAVKATNASATTSKMVLTNGVPAQTFFFSSSGGRTQNSEDVWGSKLSYLRSVDDRWSLDATNNPTNSSWGPLKRSQTQLAAAFGLSNVARIDLSNRYASGAVRLAKAWSTKGTYAELAGVKLVSRLGFTSRWYRLAGTPAPAPPPAKFSVAVNDLRVDANAVGQLRGSVSPARYSAGDVVSIRRWDAAAKKWAYAGQAKVSTAGSFSFAVSGRWPELRRYQVYKASESCGTSCWIKGTTSSSASVAIVGRFSVGAATPTPLIRSGATVTVRGQVGPARFTPGALISVQRYDAGSGRWLAVGKARLDKAGRYSAAVTGMPMGRHRITVLKPQDRCTDGICTMATSRSKAFSLTVQRAFTVTAASTSTSRRSLTVKGTVRPSQASSGERVAIQSLVAGRWTLLGGAIVGADGRFSRTFTARPVRNHTLRVWIPRASCVAGVCVNPAGRSLSMKVTPRAS